MRAAMLVRSHAKGIANVVAEIKKVKGVEDAFPVFGRFDIVTFIEGSDFNAVKETAKKIVSIPGIRSSETLPEAP